MLLRERPADRERADAGGVPAGHRCAGRDAELEGRRVFVSSGKRPRAAGDRVRPAARGDGGPADRRRTQRKQIIHLRSVDERRETVPPTQPRAGVRQPLPRGARALVPIGALSVRSPRPGRSRRRNGRRRRRCPTSGGEEAPAPPRTGSRRWKSGSTELNDRLRESEEPRQKSISPLSWNGYVDFGFFVPRRQRRRRLDSRHRADAPVPAVLQLLVDVPGRHPGDRDQHAAARWRTWATRPTRPASTASTRTARPASS